ncbi:Homeodomain-like domain-containing protein [Streptomyces sp. MnatMP-M27]|uniref:helix-turn-helix domain-containing protein n=1 Tax=Streptomyces sp. MnatMP-M27 TaxID=1839768 RepID=UPI00081DE991|nr:helix-turn-helix domain-containing protein [Streptomyces sp. MnatMP-M27]SCF91831.1 Homeodomain-like domain-containing protein [Streptomyces sp. MnatMP-M27]
MCDRRQAFRERIRLEAVERFAAGTSNAEVAKDLRVSVRSVQRWRRAWHDVGGLRSAGPVSRPKLSEALFTVLGPGPRVRTLPDVFAYTQAKGQRHTGSGRETRPLRGRPLRRFGSSGLGRWAR